jgi:hypothetical protein
MHSPAIEAAEAEGTASADAILPEWQLTAASPRRRVFYASNEKHPPGTTPRSSVVWPKGVSFRISRINRTSSQGLAGIQYLRRCADER